MTKGTYVALRLTPLSNRAVRLHCLENGIAMEAPSVEQRLHTTVIYSRKHCPDMPQDIDPLAIYTATFKDWHLFDNGDGTRALVMLLNSPAIEQRHRDLMLGHDATYDYPQYHPHITVNYRYPGANVSDLKRYPFLIILGEEYIEDLDITWGK